MCGISLILDHKPSDVPTTMTTKRTKYYGNLVKLMTEQLEHRGPDSFGYKNVQTDSDHFRAYLGHARLSIVDPIGGYQPLTDSGAGDVNLIINGELYNHLTLRKGKLSEYKFLTNSDCEVIIPLYGEIKDDFTEDAIAKLIDDNLDGIFAFCLVDKKTGNYFIARDAIGINPLYYMYDSNYKLYAASELKSLVKVQTETQGSGVWYSDIREFPPGSFMSSCDPFKVAKWYQPKWLLEPSVHKHVHPNDLAQHKEEVSKKIIELLEQAVVKMMMSDVPFGVLLSGGLDSSVVASMVVKHSKMRVESESKEEAWYPRIHTFSVGLSDSPDLVFARDVAKYLGTVHHEIIISVEDVLDALSSVVGVLETFDLTTVRASLPMALMSKKIKTMGFKMVLSGEGSDEIFSGYLYNHWAPNADELHTEGVRKVSKLHLYDCLRANKSMSGWSVECRPPFLDKDLVNYVMGEIDPELKMIKPGTEDQFIEKGLLRQAFETYYKDGLPESVLWRIKEQFSDGVGKSHIDALKDYAEKQVSDEMMANAHVTFPISTPYTKEHYLYRSIFEKHFPSKMGQPERCPPHERSIACSSQTALKWKAEWNKQWDPSGKSKL